MDLTSLFPGQFCVIGNFPYNVSSQIFFKVLEYRHQIPFCSRNASERVAERIASAPGKKAYGILSVLMQAYYTVEYLFTVSEHVFDPPPKVKSAVIRFTPEMKCNISTATKETLPNDSENNLQPATQDHAQFWNPWCQKKASCMPIPIFDKRPEQLGVAEFVKLTNMVENALKENK